ncbi:11213_t:CDS:1, partial [Acaulospora colombiana]
MEEEAIMEEGMDEDYDAHARGFGYPTSRASDMYKRIAAVSSSGNSGGPGSVSGMAIGKSGMNA